MLQRNDSGSPRMYPTLNPPIEVADGETVDYPELLAGLTPVTARGRVLKEGELEGVETAEGAHTVPTLSADEAAAAEAAGLDPADVEPVPPVEPGKFNTGTARPANVEAETVAVKPTAAKKAAAPKARGGRHQ